jgi:hypothetical protein
MEQILLAAVLLVGALGVGNLLLTIGVIRRLRNYEELLTDELAQHSSGDPVVGTALPEFSARTVGGRSIGLSDFMNNSYFAFVSVSCAPCGDQLSRFVELMAARPDERSLVVIEPGGQRQTEEFVAMASRTSDVVLGGGAFDAFRIDRWPTFLYVEEGRVIANANQVALLAVKVSA